MAMLSPKFDDLTIGHDFLFKKVMRNPRICKHLLEEVLQAPIAEISYPEIEKTIDVFYYSRGVRLDVIVADEKHTHYNLEMQVKNTTNPKTGQHVLPKRTRYYQAMLDVDALQKGRISTYCQLRISFLSVLLISSEEAIIFTPSKSAAWKRLSWNFRTKRPSFFSTPLVRTETSRLTSRAFLIMLINTLSPVILLKKLTRKFSILSLIRKRGWNICL